MPHSFGKCQFYSKNEKNVCCVINRKMIQISNRISKQSSMHKECNKLNGICTSSV